MKLSESELQEIAGLHDFKVSTIKNNYVIAEEGDGSMVIFQATYERTSHARFPEDGKLRELNSEYFWMTAINQSIVPKPGIWDISLLPHSIIYTERPASHYIG